MLWYSDKFEAYVTLVFLSFFFWVYMCVGEFLTNFPMVIAGLLSKLIFVRFLATKGFFLAHHLVAYYVNKLSSLFYFICGFLWMRCKIILAFLASILLNIFCMVKSAFHLLDGCRLFGFPWFFGDAFGTFMQLITNSDLTGTAWAFWVACFKSKRRGRSIVCSVKQWRLCWCLHHCRQWCIPLWG